MDSLPEKSTLLTGTATLFLGQQSRRGARSKYPSSVANNHKQLKIELPKIADEPRAIDPSELLPPELAVKAPRIFSDSSLREVVAWFRRSRVDKNSLNEIGISPAEPVSDRLSDDPIYVCSAALGLWPRLRMMSRGRWAASN